MHHSLIADLLCAKAPMDSVTVCGWIRSRRDAKNFSFIAINDGSTRTHLQCVIDADTEAYANLGDANNGASVCITGSLVPSQGAEQAWEIHGKTLTLLGTVDPDYPLQKKRHSDEFLRTIAHLRPRTNKYGAMLRIRAEAAFAVHRFFHENHFYNVQTPILTGSDCEGAGEMFRVTSLDASAPQDANDFFSKPCRLTVSGQLEGEALALALGKIYTFGPTFRAEHSNTPRHVAEFWMIEPEVAFCDLNELMDLAERFVQSVIGSILDRAANDLALFDQFVAKGLLDQLKQTHANSFARLSYAEAIDILTQAKTTCAYPVHYGIDLQTEHERYLAESFCKKPVFITDYPKDIKPFYMRVNDDGKTVAAMDLLVPGIGELIGGSQREERQDLLQSRMAECGQKPADYWWYTDLRRFGSVPHAGFGLGFERLLMMLTGISNIRDVIAFPRTPGSLDF